MIPSGGSWWRGPSSSCRRCRGQGRSTLGLLLLAEARRRALAAARPGFLCAVDPSRTLHAPAVATLLEPHGVGLDKLLVLQPDADRLLRTSVRAFRSGAFAGVLVDAGGQGDLSTVVTGVRRLALAAEESRGLAVLLTSSRARRGLPLPVAARALVETVDGELHVRFLRHRHGPRPPLRLRVDGAPTSGGTSSSSWGGVPASGGTSSSWGGVPASGGASPVSAGVPASGGALPGAGHAPFEAGTPALGAVVPLEACTPMEVGTAPVAPLEAGTPAQDEEGTGP